MGLLSREAAELCNNRPHLISVDSGGELTVLLWLVWLLSPGYVLKLETRCDGPMCESESHPSPDYEKNVLMGTYYSNDTTGL